MFRLPKLFETKTRFHRPNPYIPEMVFKREVAVRVWKVLGLKVWSRREPDLDR